jgi:hypothetical protein
MLRTLVVAIGLGMGVAVLPPGSAGAEKRPEGVLFSEGFEDQDLAKRGWYDGSQFRIVGGARAGKGCIEYEWADGDTKVRGSSPVRHLFEPADEVAIRFYLKLSKGWGWSGQNFHPHLTHFLTTENPKWHGPAASHLTLYIEPVGGKLRLAAQDIQNADAPHGLTQGPLRGGYNGKFYDSKEVLFNDDQWHCVEAQFKLNTLDLTKDRPNPDGIVRGWFDGKLVVDRTDVILRSTDFPKMKFNQFLMAPYFGPGLLPHAQKLWIDELAVGTKRIGPLPVKKAEPWWLRTNLRVATYEFLERGQLGRDLSVDEIMSWIERMGGCDLLLMKGFHYWQGKFDDSSWGYPRFRDKIAALTPRLHRAGMKAGVFGFTDRKKSYSGQPDHERIMAVWKGYADMGIDILFVDEESGEGGLSIPAACLEHCDQLRAKYELPVGIFLYGRASEAGRVREIAAHADVVGEMGYNLFLEARGDYGLAEVTRAWSSAVKSARKQGAAYWTGAMVPEEREKGPGTPFWRERFGGRGLGGYFSDYAKAAIQNGATGVYFHSICRLAKLPPREQDEVVRTGPLPATKEPAPNP